MKSQLGRLELPAHRRAHSTSRDKYISEYLRLVESASESRTAGRRGSPRHSMGGTVVAYTVRRDESSAPGQEQHDEFLDWREFEALYRQQIKASMATHSAAWEVGSEEVEKIVRLYKEALAPSPSPSAFELGELLHDRALSSWRSSTRSELSVLAPAQTALKLERSITQIVAGVSVGVVVFVLSVVLARYNVVHTGYALPIAFAGLTLIMSGLWFLNDVKRLIRNPK